MERIQQNSKVIFLEVPFSQILERVPSFLDRGFAKAPNQSVENAFVERQELYKKFYGKIFKIYGFKARHFGKKY